MISANNSFSSLLSLGNLRRGRWVAGLQLFAMVNWVVLMPASQAGRYVPARGGVPLESRPAQQQRLSSHHPQRSVADHEMRIVDEFDEYDTVRDK